MKPHNLTLISSTFLLLVSTYSFAQKEKPMNNSSSIAKELIHGKTKHNKSTDYKLHIHTPKDHLDKQINFALVTHEQKILMPIFEPLSSTLINPKRSFTLGEIGKKIRTLKKDKN